MQQTADGGFIISGDSQSNDGDVSGNHLDAYGSPSLDYWIVKLDVDGNLQWQKSLGGSGNEITPFIQQTTDGGFIVAGSSTSDDGDVSGHHGSDFNYDYWIVKLDLDGNLIWQKSLGGNKNEFAQSVQETNDGGFIVAGSSASNTGNVSGHHGSTYYNDYWIVKLNSTGNLVWEKSLGGDDDDNGRSIQQIADSGFIVAGYTWSSDGDVHSTYSRWRIHYCGTFRV